MPADILAIIPFYKRQDQLDRCLAALAASSYPIEPWIHDNNVNNVGFTRACNLGLRESVRRGHKYAVLLNQDCYVKPEAVGNVVAFMDAHPRCAIAGPKQLRAEEPDLIIHGGCAQAYPTGAHFTGRVSQGQCAVSLPMPWVNGACMVIRTEALWDTGLMDENLFLIASDSDFCYTARQRGWEVWYCAESVVLHEGGGVSSKQPSLTYMEHFNADQRYFRDKWIGTQGYQLLKEVPPAPGKKAPQEAVAGAMKQAADYLNQGHLEHAELVARNLLNHEPDQPDALVILGSIYLRTKMAALGARELKKALAKRPDSAQIHVLLADCLLSCGLGGEAVPHYRRARELGAQSPELSANLALALHTSGDIAGAQSEHRALAQALPPNHQLLQFLNQHLTSAK
jgi:GT2 family glycosyltransferase